MGAVTEFKTNELQLIRRTVAKECNDDEFRLFVHMCRQVGLDPLRRQVFAFVFGKSDRDQSKRQLTLVTSIGGYRSIAERTGNYRPDDKAPRYTMCEKNELNPLGIESCEVTVYKFSHGDWWPVVGQAFWDEYVPLKKGYDTDESGKSKPNGKFWIDTTKTGWVKMPRIMIAKCAEAAALRKAWPDDFSAIHAEEETHRQQTLDAVEELNKADQDERLARIGAREPSLMIDWLDGKELDRVPVGKFMDRSLAFLGENSEAPMTIQAWQDRNCHSLREFWALQKSDALELRKKAETAIAKATTAAKEEEAQDPELPLGVANAA